jgi:hypothetical protein
MSKIGTFVFLKLDGIPLIGETSSAFTSSSDAIDVSNKLSGRDTNVEYGRINRTISVSSIGSTDPDSTKIGFDTAMTAQTAGTKVDFWMTHYEDSEAGEASGGYVIITGSAVLTNISQENPDNAPLTFSMDLQVDGTPDIDVNTAITFSTLTADGASESETTDLLTLTFSADPVGLVAGNITVTGATKGVLAGTGVSRTLAISSITVDNGETITVDVSSPEGLAISPKSKTVVVYVA